MTYICVKWKHSFADEPILLYSELDARRFETRKLEIFADGRCGFASAWESSGGTRLGEAPIPTLEKILCDPQFEPDEITQAVFERAWEGRKSG